MGARKPPNHRGSWGCLLPFPSTTRSVTSGKPLPSGPQDCRVFTDLVKPSCGGQRPISSLMCQVMLGRSPNFSESWFSPHDTCISHSGVGTLHRLWSWPAGVAQVGVLQWPGRGLWQEGMQGSQR